MTVEELEDQVAMMISSSLFWKEDSHYSIETLAKAIVDYVLQHCEKEKRLR